MDAESKDLLRDWLIRSLEPVCDADPEVLSKYVLALIQNDPKKDGLQEICISKLEEFLGDETKGFVGRLFNALETGSYKATHEEGEGMGPDGGYQQHSNDSRNDENSRRRGRTNSEDEEERRRFNKRRRDDERSSGDGQRRDGAMNGRRQPPYAGRGDMRGGRGPHNGGAGSMMGGRGGGDGFGMDRRRNFPPEWGMPPPQHMGMWQPPHFPPRGGYPMPDFDPSAFNPENPGMGPPPHHMGMMMPRHMGGQFYPPQGGRGGPGRGRGGQFAGGRGGEFGAAGKDGDGADNGGAKTTLRVSNVDPKYVNMTKLSLHFSKFGNVVNVQMRPNFKCAYVQYATEEEAKKAFHSPIPVCNNRFIEVKWAKYDAKDPQGAPSVAEQSAAESKEGDESAPTAGENGQSASTITSAPVGVEGAAPEKQMTPEELRAAALEQGRKVLEQKRELLEKQRQLAKQKEELVKRQLAQHKELLERISQNSDKFSIQDKRDLLNKITALSEDLKALQPRSRAVLSRSDSGEDSSNINGLKAELSALEAEASSGGPSPVYGAGRGGGRWSAGRGYGRGGRGGRGGYAVHSHTLDNRTTIVKVENLPEEARDTSVLEQHFGNFGAIERVVVDEASPALGYIKFQDRYGGQAALSHGGVYGETTLQMTWVEPQEAPAALSQQQPQTASVVGESNEVREKRR